MNRIVYKVTIILFAIFVIGVLFYVARIKYLENKYPWHIYKTQAYKAWKESKGKNVTIAFLDTGIHDELLEKYKNRIVAPYNILEQSTNITDKNGHGTSIICAATCDYKTTGIYGIAPEAKIMPVVVMDELGRAKEQHIIDGIIYAVDNGADIINLSFGSRYESENLKTAIDYAESKGVIVVSAVGDYKEERVLYPAKYDTVIATQSQSKLGIKYKEASWGDEVDILIPGEYIQTLGIDSETGKLIEHYENGSSVSTALMSGIIALKLSKKIVFTPEMCREYISQYKYKYDDKFINIYKFVKD